MITRRNDNEGIRVFTRAAAASLQIRSRLFSGSQEALLVQLAALHVAALARATQTQAE